MKIRIDDPANALPGPAADVGASDFTFEFWIKATAQNDAPAAACGATRAWRGGNVVVDRDRLDADRGYGIAIAGGSIVFGVSGAGTGDYTLCATTPVTDGAWHHVAVERRRSDGHLWIFVDGTLDAQADGPDGDVSYPDNAAAVPCNEICTEREPYLVLGGAKFDVGGALARSFSGWIDELRISTKLRYTANFRVRARRSSPTSSPPRYTIATKDSARRCATSRRGSAAARTERSGAAASPTARNGRPTRRSTSARSRRTRRSRWCRW